MRRHAAALAVAAAWAVAPGTAAAADKYESGSVYARVSGDQIVLGNSLVERRWERSPFRTLALVDHRGHDRVWSRGSRDFALRVGSAELDSEAFEARSVEVSQLAGGGLRLRVDLAPVAAPAGLSVERVVEAYPDIAGFRTDTTLRSSAALTLSGATLDEVAAGTAAPTIHAFRAGGDWREPGWDGPPFAVGDAHPGDWRETRSGGAGDALDAPGEWISLEAGGQSAFLVMERNDFPSSRARYDGRAGGVYLDYSRDVLSLGPFEELAHLENPGSGAGRPRTVHPGVPLALPGVFTGFGRGDGDQPWQFHRYLVNRRLTPYPHAVTFNSNGVDSNRISTGAKDDMDYATVQEIAPIARRLGVDTFILDDGWQARSGDWWPDSAEYPEPRYPRFPHRFPDSEFRAVRDAIAPMNLGLWMSPTFFHPSSRTFAEHPEWMCQPVGDALLALNESDPDSGSNEAGIVPWGPLALPHVEGRIRYAIEHWDVRYFKFDFLLWLDCAGQGDLYEFHDAFLAMLDRLRRDYPSVTFQIDETNDYRLFPFESVSRGPTWFQNGSPSVDRVLHNLWDLSPYVPAFALGQHALADEDFASQPVDTLMAAALLSHITFFQDPRRLPDTVIDRVGEWTSFYKQHRADLAGVVYPLLQDPMSHGWTALQAWDPVAGRGALLAFRQQSQDATRRIALRNVPAGRTFELYEAPTGTPVETATSAELASGIDVTVAAPNGARVLLIRELS